MSTEVVQEAELTQAALGKDLQSDREQSVAHLLGEDVGDLLDGTRLSSLLVTSRGHASWY